MTFFYQHLALHVISAPAAGACYHFKPSKRLNGTAPEEIYDFCKIVISPQLLVTFSGYFVVILMRHSSCWKSLDLLVFCGSPLG